MLPFALKVAGDPKADKLVRDEMFGVIEGIGGLEARSGPAGIISSDREEIVRYRAFEVGARRRRPRGSCPRSTRSRPAAAYKKVDVDDLLVQLIEKLGAPARPALVKALDSHAPLTRMTAVMALEQVGRAPTRRRSQKLAATARRSRVSRRAKPSAKRPRSVAESAEEEDLKAS